MGKRELESVTTGLREAVFTEEEVLSLIHSSQRNVRSYYVEIAKTLGIETAIFLSQVEYWWLSKDRGCFYKYKDDCDSAREGDAWTSELVMSRSKIDAILEVVGTRVKGKARAEKLAKEGTDLKTLVVYYKPNKGAMVWFFNEKLFVKLRAWLLSTVENQQMAICRNSENGHLSNSDSSYITELTQSLTTEQEKEKISKKEKDSGLEGYLNEQVELDAAAEKLAEERRQKVKEKANKPTYRPSQKLVEAKRNARRMPLDFSLKLSTIERAKAEYSLTDEIVKDEEKKYRNYCINTNTTITMVDFDLGFVDWWLVNKKKYDEARTTKDAGATRLEGLRELAAEDFSRGIAETSLADLGADLERYYDSVYGSRDSS